MEIYPPYHLTPEESRKQGEDFNQRAKDMRVSNDALVAYVRVYHESYRKTVEEFFPSFARFIPFYANYPFKTTIVRLGPNGVIIGHRFDKSPDVTVTDVTEFQPPMESVNIVDIVSKLQAEVCSFDFSIRTYDSREAEQCGVRDALNALLEHFWLMLVPNEQAFEELCRQLLAAEGIELLDEAAARADTGIDAVGSVILNEPAGFRRKENWGFEFKHYRQARLSANELRQAQHYLATKELALDVLCLLTSEDLTSIGRSIVIQNQQLRVWDRPILNLLVNKHPSVFSRYFKDYPIAVDELSRRFTTTTPPAKQSSPGKLEEFRGRLQACPTGKANFAVYEKIGIDVFTHLFSESLGEPKPQERTADGKQRRDVLFRNKRIGGFWQRIFHRFDADLVVVDFKNYGEAVGADVIFDVEKYANKALGRFVLVVSRLGADQTVEAAQLRTLRDREIIIPVISDNQLLEMVQRKQRGQSPEDILEDCLDEILRKY